MSQVIGFIRNGRELWAIENGNSYFIWCYSNKAFAEFVATKVYPGNPNDRAANWRDNLDHLTVSERTIP